MIKFKVNGKSYNLKTTWDEVTIADGIKVTELSLPEHMQKEQITMADLMDLESLIFIREVITILSVADAKDMEKSHAGDLIVLFKNILQLVLDLFNMAPLSFSPQMLKEFNYQGETYLFPTSQTFNEILIPATNLDAVSFVESANLLSSLNNVKEGGLKQMPLFIACYCKKDGETFDQFTILKRGEMFTGLPMSVAWEVFFCMVFYLTSQVKDLQSYLPKEAKKPVGVIMELFQRGYMQQLQKGITIGTQ